MKSKENHLETLSEIRSLMERSSRFISLSGLSGVFAGTCALFGAAATYWYFGLVPFVHKDYYEEYNFVPKLGLESLEFLLITASLVLLFAFAGGVYFTTKKAKKKGQKIWDKLSQKLLINLLIPLVTGAIFCFALLIEGKYGMIAPAMLIFYGLGLVNGGKYTLNDIHYLGLCQIALGLIALFVPGYGLEFWAIGFGVLHIIYGIIMYNKYEKN